MCTEKEMQASVGVGWTTLPQGEETEGGDDLSGTWATKFGGEEGEDACNGTRTQVTAGRGVR